MTTLNPLLKALLDHILDGVDQEIYYKFLFKSNEKTLDQANNAYNLGLNQLVEAKAKGDFARIVEERFKFIIMERHLEPLQAITLIIVLAAHCDIVEPAQGNWILLSICDGWKRTIPVMQDGSLMCTMQDFLEDPTASLCYNVNSESNLSYDELLAGIIDFLHV